MEDIERKIVRPATRRDWPRFAYGLDKARKLFVADGTEVYFRHLQVVEVHRPVTRTFTKWWGLRKYQESFDEIEEAIYFQPSGSETASDYFYFRFYEEKVLLKDLPDETLFIATDKFVRRGGRIVRKKKSWLKKLISALTPAPEPEIVPA